MKRKTSHVEGNRQSVLTKAVLRSADRLGLTPAELAQILGRSPTTVSRMANDRRYQLDEHSKEWELAALLVRLYCGLAAMLADDEKALRQWIHSPNTDLRAAPIQRIITIAGLVETVAYVDANRARV